MTAAKLEAFSAQLADWVNTGQLPGAHFLLASKAATIDAAKSGSSGVSKPIIETIVGHADIQQQTALHSRSLFRLASASKLFVSVGFLTLIESGELKLSDPVASVLPEYKSLQCFAADGSIHPATGTMTLNDLLRHSCGYGYGSTEPYRSALMAAGLLGVDQAGMDHWLHPYSLRDWAARLAEVPMEHEPGTTVSYGLGHDLLGAVIEVVSGQNLADFMTQRLFEPLGFNDTFFVVPEHRIEDLTAFYTMQDGQLDQVEAATESAFNTVPTSFSGGGGWDMLGNGGLVSSAQDFGRLLSLILNDGRQGDISIVKPALMALLKSGASSDLPSGEMLPGCSYSFGAACVDDPDRYAKAAHGVGPAGKLFWGGSTNTFYYYLPEQNIWAVFFTHTFPFAHLNAIYRFSGLSASDTQAAAGPSN